MQYNSSKENLEMPEYGRNVQLLVNHARTIEDDEFRQAFAEKIVELMHQMNPQNRTIEDYRTKLWKHLFQIARFDLNVKPPEGDPPTREEFMAKPSKVSYPKADARFRHYGTNVQRMIRKARDMEAGPKREAFTGVIASYMKLAYRTWSREHFVSDEVIKADLISLSDGELSVRDSIYVDPINTARANENSKDKRRGKRGSNNRNNGKYGRNNNGKNYRRK